MQGVWSADELGERWSLLPEDLALLAGLVDAGKLGFAVQLAFWRQHGRFPDDGPWQGFAPRVHTWAAVPWGEGCNLGGSSKGSGAGGLLRSSS